MRLKVAAVVLGWIVVSCGFFSLHQLMRHRPQFSGAPGPAPRASLVQDGPRLMLRRVPDDIAVVQPVKPDRSDIEFVMRGRRDHRGLRTVTDMGGTVRAIYTLTNTLPEEVFLLFRFPHPRLDGVHRSGSRPVNRLQLATSIPGIREDSPQEWIWSGKVGTGSVASFSLEYEVASLQQLAYRVVESDGLPNRHLRITFRRHGIDTLHFESGDGLVTDAGDPLVWERFDFLGPESLVAAVVDGRSPQHSLLQLLEMGPVISLLFLATVGAMLLPLPSVGVPQTLTLIAAYALYFPLVVYLSSRFSLAAAVTLAAVIPGALLANHVRWITGRRLGLVVLPLGLILYQVFPTLAAFAGWNRGMVLLCLGTLTLGVLIDLQNRALRRATAPAPSLAALLLLTGLAPVRAPAESIEIRLPETWTRPAPAATNTSATPLLAPGHARYQVRPDARHLAVEGEASFEIVRPGSVPLALIDTPAHITSWVLESDLDGSMESVQLSPGVGLTASIRDRATVRFAARVPVDTAEGRRTARIPLLLPFPGTVLLELDRADVTFRHGDVWTRTPHDLGAHFEVGVQGTSVLIVEWPDRDPHPVPESGDAADPRSRLYGIGLRQARHLTVVNADGDRTHFAEFELPAAHEGLFHLRLPEGARPISVLVDGSEIAAPPVEDGWCRVRLPTRDHPSRPVSISIRLAQPPERLGFIGSLDLALPEIPLTAGMLEWVVAFPKGFELHPVSGNLESQSAPSDLGAFGDFGRAVEAHPQLRFARTLAPPGPVRLQVRYRQRLPD